MRGNRVQVGSVTFTISGMMQQGINVMKDFPLSDRLVFLVNAELFKRPIGDVLSSVRAVFVIGIEREALRATSRADKM